MTLTEILLIILLILIFAPKGSRPHPRVRVAKFRGPPGPRPVTPEPRYICSNCGMLINTGHGHTREECEAYAMEPTNPDMSLRKAMKERPGYNDPKIREPRYLEPGTFKNWGSGK